jgi:hypothetical protein
MIYQIISKQLFIPHLDNSINDSSMFVPPLALVSMNKELYSF